MHIQNKIFVAGHTGLVGSAIVRKLKKDGFENIITAPHNELDLTDQTATRKFFEDNKPDYVFLAAAKVGGIHANNTYPADFIYVNLQIQNNVIEASYQNKVKKLLLLGSSCFVPDSIIRTDVGFKFIQDIRIGDRVLTDKNRYMPILKTHKRDIDENILRINFWGWNKIECTSEHRIYTVDSGFKKAGELTSKDTLIIPIDIQRKYPTKVNIFTDKEFERKYDSFIEFKALEKGTNLSEFSRVHGLNRNILGRWGSGGIPYGFKIRGKEFDLGNGLGFLSGFFVADGHISGSKSGKRGSKHQVGFSKSIEKLKIIEKELVKITDDPLNMIEKKVCYTLTLSNEVLFDYFNQFYKGYEQGNTKGTFPKVIPNFIKYNVSDLVIKEFVRGYWFGDGHFAPRKDRRSQYIAATASTSKELIYDLQMLLARLGILSSVYIKKLPATKVLDGRIINQNTQYHLRITGKWAEIFGINVLCLKLQSMGKIKNTSVEFKDNCIYMGIKSISNVSYKGPVHDLSVDEDYTYTCNGFIVHNCIYPKFAPQPIREDSLMQGALEPTNAPYGLAKIAGIMMCESYNRQYGTNYISCMPTNLYGPCFDTNTEVLTCSGIKNIKEIKIGDKVYTLNPNTNKIEISEVEETQKYFSNEMVNFSGLSVDLSVTPDHTIWLKHRVLPKIIKKRADYFKDKAGRRYGQLTFPDSCSFNIVEDASKYETISLRSYCDENHLIEGSCVRDFQHSHSQGVPYEFKMSDFMEFLGWYISEGSVTFIQESKGGVQSIGGLPITQCRISQNISNGDNCEKISDMLNRMGLPNQRDKTNKGAFYFTSRMFYNYIKQEIGVGAYDVKIPAFVFNLDFPSKYREILFEFLMFGDGNKSGRRYNTASDKLKDNILLLSFLVGKKVGSVKKEISSIPNKYVWRISYRIVQPSCTVKYKDISVDTYQCAIPTYCITVKDNHIIYAGKNGKLNWVGQCDNYHPENSHVLPALLRRIHEAKEANSPEVVIWGTGNPLREFLYVDDLADACLFLMDNYNDNQTINVGSGTEIKIRDLVDVIKEVVGYQGKIVTDTSKPDGTPRKLIDSSKIYSMGWKSKMDLKEGIRLSYEDFLSRF
jgi:nucleoside-diphosphate-sugar epimerase